MSEMLPRAYVLTGSPWLLWVTGSYGKGRHLGKKEPEEEGHEQTQLVTFTALGLTG